MKPWKLSIILLIGSLALTAVLLTAGLPFFFLFLFVPLLPFLGKGNNTARKCPVCGWETTGDERFCPYDANLLMPGEE